MGKLFSLTSDKTIVGHCRNCKWWRPMSEKVGFCMLVSASEGIRPPARMKLETHDDVCRADLFTSPDFGCVEFVPTKDSSRP